MFQIKDFRSITLSIINYMKSATDKITDFSIGSVVRTMIEGPASEIDELYQKMFIGLREAIPVAIYRAFDFELQPAIATSGNIHVTITPQATDTLVPAGTVFRLSSSSVNYTSQTDVTITAGDSSADVFVVCSTPGIAGNVAALQTFTLSPNLQPLVSATNLAALNNGVPQETEEQRKSRFAALITALNHGTPAAIYYGLGLAKLYDASGNVVEAVQKRSVVEPYVTDDTQPIGLVECYIHNGSSGASSALLNKARDVVYGYYDSNGVAVPGWKAAGVHVEIYGATVVSVPVTATLTVSAGYDSDAVKTSVQTAISDYIANLDIGQSAIRAEIIAIAMGIEGVTNFIPSAPTGDTASTNKQKLMPGTINLTLA